MKIAVDISQVGYEGTGVSVYTCELVRNLLKIDKVNEYLLFGFGNSTYAHLNSFVRECKQLSPKIIGKIFKMPEKIMNLMGNSLHFPKIESFIGQADLYHSSDWIQYPADCKKITTVHDLVMYLYPDLSNDYIVKTHKKRLRWVRKQCDGVITVSESTRLDLIKTLSFDPQKVKTIYSGVDDLFSTATPEKNMVVRTKYNLPDKYVLAVGTREPRKNLSRLIEAFRLMVKEEKFSQYHLVIVGNYGWGEELVSDKNIMIIGYVDRNDMPSMYSLAQIFAYPSLYEGFGLPILEAMKSGCPVLTSNVGSMREISDDCVVHVDPNDVEDIFTKLKDILTVPNLKKTLIEKGKVHAEGFSWKKTARETLDYYENIYKL